MLSFINDYLIKVYLKSFQCKIIDKTLVNWTFYETFYGANLFIGAFFESAFYTSAFLMSANLVSANYQSAKN